MLAKNGRYASCLQEEGRNHGHTGSSVPGSGYVRKTILLLKGHVNIVKNSATNLANSAVFSMGCSVGDATSWKSPTSRK